MRLTAAQALLVWNIARALSIAGSLFFLALTVSQGPPQPPEGPGIERDLQYIFVALGVVATFIAWYSPRFGGALLLLAGLVLGVAAATRYTEQTALLVALIFVVPGVLFLISWGGRQHPAWQAVIAAAVIGLMAYGAMEARARHEYSFGPAHPQSSLEAEPFEDVEWVWSGGVTSTSVTVNARIAKDGAASARLFASTSPSLASPVFSSSMPVKEDTNSVVSLRLSNLAPGTKYYFAVEVDGVLDQERQGSVSTFPDAGTSFSIVVGSCARTGSNGMVYEAIREHDPLLFIIPGDIHYENITTDSINKFRDAYTTLVTSPVQQALYLNTPIAYVWDDHDFGGSNSTGSSAAKKAARLAYRENVPHYDLPAGDGNEPIYSAFDVGDVRFILTDTRSVRDSEDYPGGGKSLLGAKQREWFKQELLRGSRDYRLVVFVSAVPWIAPADSARDDWGGYAAERAELANFIADNEIDNLLMLAGDAHMLGIDDGTNSDYSDGGGFGFPVLHAAALDRPGSVKGGPYSEGAFPGAGQYGLVTFQYQGNSLTVAMAGLNYKGETLVDYSFVVPVRGAVLSGTP